MPSSVSFKSFALILSLVLLFSSGCTFFRNDSSWHKVPNIIQYPDGRGVEKPYSDSGIDSVSILEDRVTQINPWEYEVGPRDNPIVLYNACISKDTPPDMAMMYRNMLQDAILGVSDRVGSAHLASIIGTEDALNLTFGFLDVLFDGLSIVFTPPGTKSALAAVSAIAGTSRSLVNEEIYANIIAPAITKAIESERNNALVDITRRRQEPITSYTVENAIADAIRYHESWSFYKGLQALTADATTAVANRAAESEDRLAELRLSLALPNPRVALQDLYTLIAATPPADQAAIYDAAALAMEPRLDGFQAQYLSSTARAGAAAAPGAAETAAFVQEASQLTDAQMRELATLLKAELDLRRR